MNKAVIKELYERTNLDTLPKEIRKDFFGVLDLGDIETLEENILEKVNGILEIYTSINNGPNKTIRLLLKYFLVDSIVKLDKGSNIANAIFNLNNTEKLLKLTFQLSDILGVNNDLKEDINLLGSKLFSRITNLIGDGYGDSMYDYFVHLKQFIVKLKEIDGFSFDGVLDIDLTHYFIKGEKEEDFYVDFIEKLGIKNIKTLGEEEILQAMIESPFDHINQIESLESTLGIKLTLNNLKNGAMITLNSIENQRYYRDLKRNNKLLYLKSIFEYFGLGKLEITSADFENLTFRLITFVKGIVDSDEEDILIKILIEYCEQLTGMRITEDNINDKNVDTFLINLATELGKDQDYYKKFFERFPDNSYICDDGNIEEEKWKSESFYMKGAYWVMSGNNEIENIEFINLLLNELDTVDDLKNVKIFSQFVDLPQGVKQNILKFIGILNRNDLIKIDLKNIDEEFINFVEETFGGAEINANICYPEGFFDGILSYKDFSNHFVGKPSLQSHILIHQKLFNNLKSICQYYNITVTLTNFKKIKDSYEDIYENIEEFYQYFIAHILDTTIDFIYNKGPKNISYENLIYILVSQGQLRVEIGMHQTDDADEKEELLISEFGLNRNHYFRKDKDGNHEINRDKKWLLSLLFDERFSYNDLLHFTKQFSGLTLGKLVKFYRDSGLRICIPSYEREIFLIHYAIDHNDFYYIKHNIEILEKFNNDLNFVVHLEYRDYRENREETYMRLDILLDKTGGFLTTTFVKNFVRKGCGEDELDKLIKSYNDTSEQLLGSEVLELEGIDENVAEAVFMAYRPTRYSLDEIVHKLSYELQDNTEHLSKVKYKKEGYKKRICRSSKELKDGERLNIKGIGKIEEGILELPDKEEEFNIGGFDFKRFFTNSTNLEDLMPIVREIYGVNYDSRIMEYRNNMGDSNYDYTRLQRLSAIFGVITKDSFESDEKPIISYISSLLSFEELKDIFLRLRKVKDNKFRKLFEKYFKNEYFEDEEELRNCLTQIFYEQLKVIASRLKKEITKELKKFGNSKGNGEEIRFNLCKNIASYFAMAGSGLCTDGDMERHNEERYLPVNIVNENSKQIIGMLMLYVEEDKDYLVVRGFNLRDELYSVYDMGSIAETMVDFVKDFAMENGYKKIYIPEHSGQHLVSNSSGLTKGIQKISLKNKDREWYKKQEKFEGGRIGQGGGFTVENLYMLLDL